MANKLNIISRMPISRNILAKGDNTMDGRLEREKKIEERINRKLDKLPKYVSDWNRNMKASRKTAATRNDFIAKVDKFLTSIDDNTKSISTKDITEQVVTDYMLSIQTKIESLDIS